MQLFGEQGERLSVYLFIFIFTLLCVLWAFWIYDFVSAINFEKFTMITSNISSPLSLSFLCDIINTHMLHLCTIVSYLLDIIPLYLHFCLWNFSWSSFNVADSFVTHKRHFLFPLVFLISSIPFWFFLSFHFSFYIIHMPLHVVYFSIRLFNILIIVILYSY